MMNAWCYVMLNMLQGRNVHLSLNLVKKGRIECADAVRP